MDPITAGTTFSGAIQFANQVRNTLFTIHDNIDEISRYVNTGSLIDITKMARVEPICIVDADVTNLEYTSDIMQSMQSIFSGYYLQAVALTGNIGKISIAKRLAPLNPNRDTVFENMKPDNRLSVESYKHRLPTTKNALAVSMEASKVSMVTDSDANKTMLEVANLSVGKIYNVDLKEGNECVTIKVAIRIMVSSLPTSIMVNLLSFKDQFDMDMKERYHAWRAGRLSFIKDLVLCRDLIDKHRTALVKDKSAVYSQILNRENNNFKAGLFNSNPSLATASNLCVISTDTAAEIEQRVGFKFSNFKARQQIFDNTNLMILAMVDKSWERVTWYYRGIQETTTTSIRDLKVANKGSNDNVLDIMKAFMAGSSPNM